MHSNYFFENKIFFKLKNNHIQEKSKDTTNKVWPLFQNMFSHFINAEKFYNNLLFLNQKSITKIGVYN